MCVCFSLSNLLAVVTRFLEGQPEGRKVMEKAGGMRTSAKSMFDFLDTLIQMLGPDSDFLEEILNQAGTRMKHMGVTAAFFNHGAPLEAILYSLEKNMKRELTKEERGALDEVYNALSGVIRASLK